jgi:hypothetical protein
MTVLLGFLSLLGERSSLTSLSVVVVEAVVRTLTGPHTVVGARVDTVATGLGKIRAAVYLLSHLSG